MVRLRELDVQQLSDRNISEPGKFFKGQEKFPPAEEQPESMLRNVGDFNF